MINSTVHMYFSLLILERRDLHRGHERSMSSPRSELPKQSSMQVSLQHSAFFILIHITITQVKLHILPEQQQFLCTLEQSSVVPRPCSNYDDKIFTVVTIPPKCYLGYCRVFHWAANLHEELQYAQLHSSERFCSHLYWSPMMINRTKIRPLHASLTFLSS